MKTTRHTIQLGFLALTLVGVFLFKGNAERWCPFGGVEAIYAYAGEGNMLCSLGVSNLYILGAVLLLTLLLRRAFCGYACPIGTLSEWLQSGARRIGLRPLAVPYRLDRALGLLKYVVLAVILYFTWTVGELVLRGYGPCYALIGRHGKDITSWAYVISAALVLVSLLIVMPFCRWLCPLAAVLSPFSRFGLARIKRSEDACVDCELCARACPMGIRVDRVRQVTAARCTLCLDCIAVCPKRKDDAIRWGPPDRLGRRWPGAVLVVIMLLCLGGAVAATYAFPLPSFVRTWGRPPERTATVHLQIHDMTCRGQATALVSYLQRDDEFAVPGYVRLRAWPGPGPAPAAVTYDPARTSPVAIKQAITEPYYDASVDEWLFSPFTILGYDPLGIEP